MEWIEARSRALERLEEHSAAGLVDGDIEELLFRVNRAGSLLFTSSSCSGRVAVFIGRDLFDKRGAGMLWVTHDPAECRRGVCGAAAEAEAAALPGVLAWVSLQPPILQVHARSLEVAGRVLECAWRSGFARAGMWWSRGGWPVVEAAGRDKLHVLLPAECGALLSLCEALARLKPRIYSLLECLEGVNGGGG
ncbi:tRNA-wybutosine modification methyltransferase TYW3 [Stetteria hydrogenophila]